MAGGPALAAALAATLLAVTSASGASEQTPKRGGTIFVGTLREPACLNAWLERCHGNIPPAGHIMNLALRGAFKIGPGFAWQYDLVSRVDYTTRSPFTLTYHIRPEARWSDGVAITAQDFEFTHETLQTLPESDREGLGLEYVRSITQVDAKTVKVRLRSRYSSWHGLFSRILPRHALRGENFASVWLDRIHNPKTGRPIGSGPFLIGGWERGQAVNFVRNARYWGEHRAYLDRVVLRFGEASDQISLLRTGRLDLVMTLGVTAQHVKEFRSVPGVRVLAVPGPLWEHFDIRMDDGAHPALQGSKGKVVRQALIYGMDRAGIARSIYGAASVVSQSAIFLSASPHYQDNWQRYRHRPNEARRLLARAGCQRGADDVYRCAGERLSLRFLTTAGAGSPRERTLQLVQRQLKQVGIEVTPVYAPSQILFQGILKSGEFDVALYNWIRWPDAALEQGDVYGCGGSDNASGYCQRLVTADLDQARRILDATQLARVLNRADRQLAKDVPVIPFVERALLAAYTTSVRNVDLSTREWNPLANAENWWLAE